MKNLREYFNTLLQSMRHGTALCVLCLLLAAESAQAAVGDVFEVDGITYKALTDSTVQVGDGTNRAFSSESTSCAIPATVSYSGTNYTVTSIGYEAFYNCYNLTSVTLPASLTSIGSYAFYNCSSLTAFLVPSDNTAFCALDGVLFTKDKTRLISYPNKRSGPSYAIPSGVTSIEGGAFSSCSGLTSVTFPASLTSIGYEAFYNCSKLNSMTFPASLTSIGSSAFYNCSGLTSVTFPASLTTIGNYAFYNCSSLTAFLVPSDNTAFCALDGVLFTKDKTRLISYPNKRSGPSYAVPSGVTSIEGGAFSSCSGLTSVTFPASLTSIGDSAFYNCYNLTSVTFPPSLTSIGTEAFFRCSSLTSLTLPSPLTSIGVRAFYYCSGLTSVTFPESLTSIGDSAFSSCSGLTSVTFPASLTSIGDSAFYNCSGLTSVTFPPSLMSIGDYAFEGCSSLTSVAFPSSLTSVGDGAFFDCSSLTSVTFPASLSSIGDGAFYDCSGLTSVTFPASLTNIGYSAFSWCNRLVYVYYLGACEPSIGSSAFSNGPSYRYLVVPNASGGFSLSKWGANSIWYGDGSITLAEALDNSSLTWTVSNPDAFWYGQKTTSYYSGSAACSGTIPDSQSTDLSCTVTGPGTLQFYWKVSSEPNYDYLQFFIGSTLQSQISGTKDWAQMTLVVPAGTQTLTWRYKKDISGASGSDCGWVDKVAWSPDRFDMNCTGGDFSAGTVTPLVPGAPVDMSWTIHSTAAHSAPFWCEAFASKTGGFDQVRFGSTVTNSYVQNGTDGTTQTIAPTNQVLKTLPDGAYSLMPVVNRYATRTADESDYVNNWTTIAGKRLRVHTAGVATSDLFMSEMSVVVSPTDPEQVTVTGIVRNEGAKPLPPDGCWIEAFYGYLSTEATLDPINTIGAGFNLKNLDPGKETSFSLTGRVPGGAAYYAVAGIVDSTDIIPESNEANNSRLWYEEGVLPTPPQNGADLAVTNISLDPVQTAPNQVVAGTLFNCSVTVRNNGTTVTGCWLEIFGSQDGGVSFMRGSGLVDGLYITPPAPGAEQTYSFANMPVKAIGDGMYTVVVVVNRDGVPGNPGDSKPLDNRMVYSTGRVSLNTPWQSGTVNLVWSEGPTFTQTSGTMTVSGKVKNTGTIASKAFWTEAFTGELEKHMGFFTRDSAVFAGGVLCESLAPGAEQEITITGPLTPGKSIGILTDSTDLIAETDETDNYDYSRLYY